MSEPVQLHPEHNILIRKLRSISPLADDEMRCLATLPLSEKSYGPDQDIIREGDRPSECCLVVEGFLCRYKVTDEGKRQIFSFHMAGDIPDLQSLHLSVMDHSLMTMTRSKLAFIPHESLRALTRRCPRVADVLWRDTLIDAAVFRENMETMPDAGSMRPDSARLMVRTTRSFPTLITRPTTSNVAWKVTPNLMASVATERAI